jgi:Flp pilus assembly protein TadB
MQETPEQTRERMAKRVKELKEEKEKRRQEDVNQRLDKRFEQNADELRKVDKDLKELKLAYERNIQLVEKQGTLQNQFEGTPFPTQNKCCSQNSTSATNAARRKPNV